ncbi:MAG: VWA domain-containing protein [Burkholderiales bacterium]|jgi:Ca-activated chloride channel family protein|nr:VWA domain-containing protein [Burkholderiales bacterium]
MLDNFHLLRPWFLIALIPAIILYVLLRKTKDYKQNNWVNECDPHLLVHLISKSKLKGNSLIATMIFISWIIAIFALSGPTWKMASQPLFQKNMARVIGIDVSSSMNSTDLSPNRMERAKYKVIDLLKTIKEGQTGMIVFSSYPFVVSPLTSDANTIINMVPVIDTNIVPVQGSNLNRALIKTSQLITQAGFNQGEIILITDSVPDNSSLATAKQLANQGFKIAVLGIGTTQNTPTINASGGFITDNSGNIVFNHLDTIALSNLAQNGNGMYVPFSEDNSDIKTLTAFINSDASNNSRALNNSQKIWQDDGVNFIWLLLIAVAIISRKGWLEQIC